MGEGKVGVIIWSSGLFQSSLPFPPHQGKGFFNGSSVNGEGCQRGQASMERASEVGLPSREEVLGELFHGGRGGSRSMAPQ